LLDELLPRLEIALPPPGETLDPAALFAPSGSGRPLWLEIGFGAGEHLAWQAESHPEVGLIGAEVFVQGVARLLRRIAEAGLANVRLYRGDAMALVAALPPAALARVFILFPDPWPKTRHHKRRIVQRETIDLLAAAMRPGAELRLATDDADYAAWILERLIAHPAFDWLARGPRDWRQRPADWPQTRYQAKALAQGRQPVYLRFQRRAD